MEVWKRSNNIFAVFSCTSICGVDFALAKEARLKYQRVNDILEWTRSPRMSSCFRLIDESKVIPTNSVNFEVPQPSSMSVQISYSREARQTLEPRYEDLQRKILIVLQH